jgi:hypothetical protein|tara:strand:- start:585 stop:821 length:237 start_codon:yes stop_codon:yes gene_type:complete
MKNSTKINHNFDIPSDISITDFLMVLNEFHLTLISSIPMGPAGGNPNITVSATPTSITALTYFIKNSDFMESELNKKK